MDKYPQQKEEEFIAELIANRLVAKEDERLKKKRSPRSGDIPFSKAAAASGTDQLAATPSPDFVKVEKNLASLGFFTPSSKRIKNVKAKTIRFTKVSDGKREEAQVIIEPGALHTLPITADQDKYLAFQKILTDTFQREGRVVNPIGFTSAELLRVLGYRKGGKKYAEIQEWLDVMSTTTIISKGMVYFAGQKRWARDRFHVFERAVSLGQEMPDGTVADQNYVWLSAWQQENLRHNHVLPVDFRIYQQLKNPIAKALVLLLQIWLFASRDDELFEKRYNELSQHLGIRHYRHLSEIKRKLGPSLDELTTHGYLTDWRIEKTSDSKGYKIVFRHGPKFHRDRQLRSARKGELAEVELVAADAVADVESVSADGPSAVGETQNEEVGERPHHEEFLPELTRRGVAPNRACEILINVPDGQEVLDQLEYGDFVLRQAPPGKFYNPTGFYIFLIRENIPVPEDFETSRKRRLREEAAHAQEQERARRARHELAYDRYRAEQIERQIAQLTPTDYQQRLTQKEQELFERWPFLRRSQDGVLHQLAVNAVHQDLARTLPLLTFNQFIAQHPDGGGLAGEAVIP